MPNIDHRTSMMRMRHNRKGFVLMSSLFTTVLLSGLAMVSYQRALDEIRMVNREVERVEAYYAAEAGIQRVVAQIADNAYTGFILYDPVDGPLLDPVTHEGDIQQPQFYNADGTREVGNYDVHIDYVDAADFVILQSTATVGQSTRSLVGRVFLESNFSKYLLFADVASFGSGDDAVYGAPTGDPSHPEGVAPYESIRPNLYFKGDYYISGDNVQVYGDTASEGALTQSTSTSNIHGDTYISAYQDNEDPELIDDGIAGNVVVSDGYKDDPDLDGDGEGPNEGDPDDPGDFPDRHDLPNELFEDLPQLDHSFYENPVFNAIPDFGDPDNFQNRYLEAVPDPGGGGFTVIHEYSDFAMTSEVATYNLPPTAIVYANGDIHIKGEVEGRVSFVSSDDIHFRDSVTYNGGGVDSDPTHSMAFLATDILFYIPYSLTVSGIFYGQSESSSDYAMYASYIENSNQTGYNTLAGYKDYLRIHGNRLLVGYTNLSTYSDRQYLYDGGLRKYRPPGLPVEPELQLVREVPPGSV